MALAQTKLYTETDYYNLPEEVRAELIDGELIYNQAAPSRIPSNHTKRAAHCHKQLY